MRFLDVKTKLTKQASQLQMYKPQSIRIKTLAETEVLSETALKFKCLDVSS